uniref:Uncharacterized protein n=1 Tax=Rhizophora mucronata TaxID=61149 RepID=A0A2P2QXC3_RHIMU
MKKMAGIFAVPITIDVFIMVVRICASASPHQLEETDGGGA